MRIAFDFDGVILDSERPLKFYADYWSYFVLGKDRMRRDEISQEECFDWTDEELNRFFAEHYDNITRESNLMVGAKEILTKLKNEGHKLYVITLRGFYREEEVQEAKSKFQELGIEFDEIYWSVNKKAEKCRELGIDIMVEDNPHNVEQFVGEKTKVLYFKEPEIREVEARNIVKVNSWMDIYREVKNLEKGDK